MTLPKLLYLLSIFVVHVVANGPQTRLPCGSGQWRDIFGQCQRFTISAGGGGSPGLQTYQPCGKGNWRNINGRCEKFTIGAANVGEQRPTRTSFQRAPCGSGHWRDIFGQCRRFTVTAADQSGARTQPYRNGANIGHRRLERATFQRAPCGSGHWRDIFGQCQRFTITAGQSQPGMQTFQPCGRGNWRNIDGQCQKFTIGTASAPMQVNPDTRSRVPCGVGQWRDLSGTCQPIVTVNTAKRIPTARPDLSPEAQAQQGYQLDGVRPSRGAIINTKHSYHNHQPHNHNSFHSFPHNHSPNHNFPNGNHDFPHNHFPNNNHNSPHNNFPNNNIPNNNHPFPHNHQTHTFPHNFPHHDYHEIVPEDWIK